jgi:tetratricopeptide (TPR) repeat protein
MSQPNSYHLNALLFLLIAGLAFAIFYPVGGYGFLNWDDDIYLQNNAHLRGGFTAKNLEWAFTANLTHFAPDAEYWAPLTLLTRIADAHFFGISSGAMHVMSVVFHVLNTGLLIAALSSLTGARGRSVVVGLLFFVHPQNMEAVMWLSARKDLIAATGLFLTLLAYARYVKHPGRGSYGLLLLAFTCALMAKPMAVSVPVLLLLLDFWPLKRAVNAQLFAEKIPLFLLAGIAALLAVLAQQDVGAMGSYPLSVRITNALYATATYVRRAVWPDDLCIFYPHTEGALSVGTLVGCAAVLVALTALAVWQWKCRPVVMTGWLWFLAGLAPVIGLVQVGRQAMADRYFYTTGIGLFLAVTWVVADAVKSRACQRVLAVVIVTILAVAAAVQVRFWKDSEAAFRRAVAVTDRNYIAHGNLGSFYFTQGNLEAAKRHTMDSLAILPYQYTAWNNLGAIESSLGRDDAAIHAYERAVLLDPKSPKAHFNLGRLLLKVGRKQEAIPVLQRTVELAPNWPEPARLLAESAR